MYKHLPGLHNQKLHGRSTPSVAWSDAALDISLSEYENKLANIPGVKSVHSYLTSVTGMFNHLVVELNEKSTSSIDISFRGREEVRVHLNNSLTTALSNGLDGKFFGNLLDTLENASKLAGFRSVTSTGTSIPLVVAARKGYVYELPYHYNLIMRDVTDEIKQSVAKSAYDYLERVYNIPAPKKIRNEDLISEGDKLSDMLKIPHANSAEVPLYLEYFMQDDIQPGKDVRFYKKL